MLGRRAWAAIGGLSLVGVAGWLATSRQSSEGALARIRREGLIRIGYAIEAPYVFLDSKGQLTGEEAEVARKVVAGLEIPRIEWVQADFGSLLDQLEEGRFDVIVAGMFITPARAQRASFSEPTFRVRQGLLVQKGNPHGLSAYEDFVRMPRLKIATLRGSIEESMIRGLGVSDAQIVVVPDALTGRVAIESGLAAGLALSSPAIRHMGQRQQLGLTEAALPFTPPTSDEYRHTGLGAAAFRRSDEDLRDAWNRQLKRIVGTSAHRLLMEEFGMGPDELPSGATSAEIPLQGR